MLRWHLRARGKRRMSWPKKIGLTFLILIAISSIAALGLLLFKLSSTQNWSSEVNASVINLFVSTLTFIITIAVTVYFNTKTQRLTLDVQEMNIQAMKFQARANLRDRIIEKRMEIYPKILEELNEVYVDVLDIVLDHLDMLDFEDVHEFKKHILDVRDIIKKFLFEYQKNPLISTKLKVELKNYANFHYFRLYFGEIPDIALLRDRLGLSQEPAIVTSDQYVKSETHYYDRAVRIIEKELQLKEIEEDIEEMTAIWS